MGGTEDENRRKWKPPDHPVGRMGLHKKVPPNALTAAGRPQHLIERIPWSRDLATAAFSGIVASGSVTPIILTVDKAVVQAAAGEMGLGKALVAGVKDILLRPHRTLMSVPFWMVWGVYGSTYIAANSIDMYNERSGASVTAAATSKLVGTTIVNMSASLIKDVAFAKMFGKQVADTAKQAPKRVPMATYGIFLLRDTFTIAGGFTVPPLMSKAIVTSTGTDAATADKIAQMVSPMGMQIICTPMHLLALNMYNEPDISVRERASAVWRTALQSTWIRMFRFLGAYGVGGVTNKELMRKGRAWTVEAYGDPDPA